MHLMIKNETLKRPEFKELPLEEGKTYRTKFQTGDLFTVVKIKTVTFKSGGFEGIKVVGVEGLYVGKEHIGLCPLAEERLIHDKEQIGVMECCPKCNTELNYEKL